MTNIKDIPWDQFPEATHYHPATEDYFAFFVQIGENKDCTTHNLWVDYNNGDSFTYTRCTLEEGHYKNLIPRPTQDIKQQETKMKVTKQQVMGLLERLNVIAADIDHYEYGLPLHYDYVTFNMVEAVLKAFDLELVKEYDEARVQKIMSITGCSTEQAKALIDAEETE